LYEEGSQVARYLEPDGRRAFGVMCDIYGRLLDEIQRQPAAVLQRRIRLGRWQKLRIALGWLLRPNARCQA
jgi:phytoene/squalene synthetase